MYFIGHILGLVFKCHCMRYQFFNKSIDFGFADIVDTHKTTPVKFSMYSKYSESCSFDGILCMDEIELLVYVCSGVFFFQFRRKLCIYRHIRYTLRIV